MKKYLSLILLISLLLLNSSCANNSIKRTYVVAGTYLEVVSENKKAAGIVYDEFRRLEKIFNLYDPDSELSRLNNIYNKPVKVSKELMELLKLSKDLYKLTNGKFDVSSGVLYKFWKDLISQGIEELPSKDQIDKLKLLSGIDFIKLNERGSEVIIVREGLKIDLGGVAKGYMVDKAAQKLRENNVDSALINAGGDIYCLGRNHNRVWNVGIKDPNKLKDVIRSEELFDEAIATSGSYEQFFELNGVRYPHIVDPITGYPVNSSLTSISVVTKNCTSADGLATAFFVMGFDGVYEFLNQNPSTMKIIAIKESDDGKQVFVIK